MTRGRRGRKKSSFLRGALLFLVGAVAGAALVALFRPDLVPKPLRSLLSRPSAGPTPAPSRPTPAPSPTSSPPVVARPTSVPADFEPAAGASRGVVALVLDDVGHDDGSLAALEELPGPLALAVLPRAARARDAAALAKRKGWDLLVHLPMEPEDGASEPGTLRIGDDAATAAARVDEALRRLPGAVGLNNHQGSKATADAPLMRGLLAAVRDRGLFFLDSKTTPASVAEREARALGVSTLARDVFLDDVRAEEAAAGGPREAIAAAWERALTVAERRGHAVVIGHPRRETFAFLKGAAAPLAARRLRLVRISELVD